MSDSTLFQKHEVYASLFEKEPPPRDFVIPGLTLENVGALIAPGGLGKSMFALQLACAIAGGEGADTLGFKTKQGKVLYATLEDSLDEIHKRLYTLGQAFDSETRVSITKNLKLLTDDEGTFDVMNPEFIAEFIEAGTGARLIIIDTLSDVHFLDENSNAHMVKVIKQLKHIAKGTKAALIYTHHVSKSAALAGQGNLQQAARGASALIDKARWCGNLTGMTPDEAKKIGVSEKNRNYYIKLNVGKQNHGEIDSEQQWYERLPTGVLRPFVQVSKKQRGRDVL